MKFPTLKGSEWTALCVAACLINVGCTKKVNRPTRADWNHKTLVEAYQQIGHTGPKWDDSAKSALTEWALVRSQSGTSIEDWTAIISNSCTAAMDEGCDDPMIRYLFLRTCMSWTATREELADAYCKMAQDMEQSPYPNIRKYYAWLRAGQQVNNTYGYGTNIPPRFQEFQIWQNMGDDLLKALSEQTIPPEEFYDASHEYLEQYRGAEKQYSVMYGCMKDRFPPDWKNLPGILHLKGEAYIAMAWQARGGGYAQDVTKEGWKLFKERLDVAEDALTRAWKLDKKDGRIAVDIIRAVMGQQQDRDHMELWFRRAMEADPNNYDACAAKLLYLYPKWYGSIEDMLAFGRECVQNQQWGGHVPLIMYDAHTAIRNEFATPSDKANYWKQPQVWQDLKAAFDRFFELNPDQVGWYHNYAWFAYQAEDWTTLNEIIPKLGPINYQFFGGKDQFDKMVALAQEHAGNAKGKN